MMVPSYGPSDVDFLGGLRLFMERGGGIHLGDVTVGVECKVQCQTSLISSTSV